MTEWRDDRKCHQEKNMKHSASIAKCEIEKKESESHDEINISS